MSHISEDNEGRGVSERQPKNGWSIGDHNLTMGVLELT